MLVVLSIDGDANSMAIVTDRLAWRNAIAEGLTFNDKLLYMREFLFKYQGAEYAEGWTELKYHF